VYQDLCGEGIYVGKGIYDVAAFARSLEGRVPKNALVSHDHFEGLHGRAGLASDVVLYEDYPPQYLAYARRLHRWIRGDWQLLPWLFPRVPGVEGQRQPNRLSLLGRWILFDNLRRSLLAPSLALLFAAAWLVLPGHPLVWMTLCILAPAGHVFTSLVTGLARGPRRSRVRPWAAGIAYALRENLGRWALYVIFLGHEALAASDAIARTLARLLVTRRHLLDWRSAEHTARLIAGRHPHLLVWTEMVGSPLLALGLGAAVAYRRPESLPWALPLLALWLAAPEIARRISRPRVRARPDPSLEDVAMLREAARRTWLFFEDFVGPGDQWLPPDNYQEEPRGGVAHRTSPTNIGMYLVSVVAARDMGWLGPAELLFRLRETLDTLERMERYRGHVYNWYDTRTLEPLLPRYISTVDSGNLAAALLVVQQACAEATASPALTAERWTGLEDGLRLLEAAVRELAAFAPDLVAEPFLEQCQRIHLRIAEVRGDPSRWISALRELCEHDCPAMERRLMDMLEASPRVSALELLREVQTWLERSHQTLCALEHDVDELVGWARPLAQAPEQVRGLPEFQAVLDALSASLRLSEVPEACRRALAVLPGLAQAAPAAAAWCDELRVALERCSANTLALRDGLLALGVRAEQGVREMDFGLLFDAESVLFRIGYDVSTGKHDPNYYDLLASEARIASFLAIAKGDVPVKHWFFLGRPMTRIRGSATLLSWGSTMFEYLMPTLFMRSGERTLLEQSCRVAADTQERYGRRRGVPWGISESGFHLFDAERNYQYRTFGVPGLGLKRGLSEDLVITPYASVLALHLRSDSVIENLGHLERLGARGLYGFYEAVDFTPERVPVGEDFAIVRSHMAHHQGMILASIVNFLQGEPLVRRFHGSSLSQSADLLLYEQVPMGVAPLMQLESVAAPPRPRRDLQPWRPVVGGPWAEFHVLSNGRLTTAVTDSGSGWTSWRELALTRWEADPTCDAQGTWIYVRDEDSREVWSAGARPTRRAADEQQVIFHPHMFEVHRRDRRIFLRMEVAIAPNEDVEVRLLALTNESDEPRRLSLTSCFEPVLAPAREDARHPAFAKLFVESESLEELSALVFTRRRQVEDGRALAVVHALVGGEDVRLTGHETDRGRFLGRGGTWELPSALRGATALSGTTGAVLDPVCALRGELELAPGATVRLAFVTAAADSRDMALDLAKRFRSLTAVEWVFQDAQTAAASEALALSMDARLLPAVQRLTSLVLQPHPALRADSATIEANGLGRPCLWGRGVSGDEPILLVEIDDARRSELLVDLLVAHRFWRWREIPVDLVVLLTGASSYGGESEGRIARLLVRSGSADWRNRRGGIFVVSADQMPAEERRLFAVAARALLRAADGRLPELMERLQFERSLPPRFVPGFVSSETEEPTPPLPEVGQLRHDNGLGGFSADGREYVVHFGEGTPTPAPWCNVLANPGFGCLVSESALGVTWSANSAEHRLTPWRNDPVSDGPAEALYLRDEETGEVWSTTPLPAGDHARSRVRHGAGYSTFECSSHGLEQSLVIFVPRADPLKVAHLSLRNRWSRQRRLTVTYYAELVLGMTRADSAPFIVPEYDTASGTLLARNPWIPEYAGRVTFLCSDAAFHGATADRGEFLGRGGSLRRPAALGRWGLSGRVSAGDDPCLALMVHVELAPGEERELSFLFGDGDDRGHALELARRYRERGAVEAARRELAAYWDGLLGAVEVRTPEPAMDLALNRWLLYQTVACRLEGRTALYQSSGAYGFRDQLQDVLALVHAEPQRTRAQLLEAARHQFEAGDVLHWWHPPGGAGVRTRCSDDLLWLPYVTARYVRATGDRTVLEEQVPFLAGDPLGEGEFERYAQYGPAPEAQDLLEHCRRALRRGLTRGAHGLPLIGSCDWNDGFSRVGVGGRGESVWLAWFAIQVARGFADLLVELGQEAEAAEWRNSADQLARDVDQHAWDGAWYLRAWYDDGDPLGSSRSSDCRIDLIAQAWAAISGAGDAGRARTALASAVEHLVDETVPLVRLLAPPFDAGPRDPGYIKDYPPGIRENGGQYTHAGTWLGFAFAALDDGEWAERVFGLLNPIARARTPEAALRYRVEPYVVAADVYGVPPHVGRGGWTWYTGAAAWLWRLGIEAVLGLRRDAGRLSIEPCIPPHWDGYEAVVRTAAGRCRVVVENPDGTGRGVAGVTLDGVDLPDGLVPLDELTGDHEVRVVLGRAVARREPSA
jgi:cyclic beta-1,2-glucan synthetase